MPRIEIRNNAGSRQRDNYWLRNERMFEHIESAAETRNAERILVITGAGHKYFLDLLAQEADYNWIDPRDYLPDQGSSPADSPEKSR